MLKRLFRHNESAPSPASAVDDLSAYVSVVEDAGLSAALRASPLLTVVDFWADWCQPCDVMSMWLEQALRMHKGQLRILTLDVDESPKTPERFGVMGLPTLIFFRDGVELARMTGITTFDDLNRRIERLIA